MKIMPLTPYERAEIWSQIESLQTQLNKAIKNQFYLLAQNTIKRMDELLAKLV